MKIIGINIEDLNESNILTFLEKLGKRLNHKKINANDAFHLKEKYKELIPKNLNINGDENLKLYTSEGTHISNGYDRIVIGDYGPFIEFSKEKIVRNNIKVKKGEEFRIKDPNFINEVKYIWLTAKDASDIKIYYQKRTVKYADYKEEMFYISPFEIKL